MPPPPPPPPLPPPGASGGPPPPPPISSNLPARIAASKDRGALLTDITKGARLKKAATNDRSAPIIDKSRGGAAAVVAGAPPIPGLLKPPGGDTPVSEFNRTRSNSDTTGGQATIAEAPRLGGLFAGGIPKLKKRNGGVETGANRSSSYSMDSTSSTLPPVPIPPSSRPSGPVLPSRRPALPSSESAPINPLSRPFTGISRDTSNNIPLRAPPPLPGSRPPPPPSTSRRPSAFVLPPLPGAAPLPPISAPAITQLPPNTYPAPPAPPPILPSQRTSVPSPLPVVRPPPSRSTPPPPPPSTHPLHNESDISSLAKQAAFNSIANSPIFSPSAAPPPPPQNTASFDTSPSGSRPSSYGVSPASSLITSMPSSQTPTRSMLDPSFYTLSNGSTKSGGSSPGNWTPSYGFGNGGSHVIEDSRWKFQDESQLPKPRDFQGIVKRYRAGRGSSVPLNLSQFT